MSRLVTPTKTAKLCADFVVIGAGIVGLTVARELRQRHKTATIIVLEKESDIGCHASGRNSGVLHSGVYYEPGTLKSKTVLDGKKEMAQFYRDNQLQIKTIGKVILPKADPNEIATLDKLHERTKALNIEAHLLDLKELRAIEPNAHTRADRAMFLPNVDIIYPHDALKALRTQLTESSVELRLENKARVRKGLVHIESSSPFEISYGHLINCAGAHADIIAHDCYNGWRYRILPFKGTSYRLLLQSNTIQIKHLIYPVPNLQLPFLGIHFTPSMNALETFIGPSVFPAFGRENYDLLKGIQPIEGLKIAWNLLKQYWNNKANFRQYAHDELIRSSKSRFLEAAREMVPVIRTEDIDFSSYSKVGIRAQLMDKETGRLVNDFVIEKGYRSTHVLNAISPAFTCAFPFARLVVNQAMDN